MPHATTSSLHSLQPRPATKQRAREREGGSRRGGAEQENKDDAWMLCVSQAVIGRNDECGGRQHIHACVCVCTRPVRRLTPSLLGADFAMATLPKEGRFFFQQVSIL